MRHGNCKRVVRILLEYFLGDFFFCTFCRYSVDYDVTAFVNGETPPFDDVLDDFQNVILANFKRAKLKDKTSRSLSFELDGIDFDLLPATNLAISQDEGSKIRI